MLQNMKEQLAYAPQLELGRHQEPHEQQQQDDGDFRKCGGIFVSAADDMTFGLNCSFCPVVCLQFDTFMQHMRDEHRLELQRDGGDQGPATETIFEAAVEAEPLECGDNEIACDFDWTEITSMLNGDDEAIMTFDTLLEAGDNDALGETPTEPISPAGVGEGTEGSLDVTRQPPETEVDLIYILAGDEQVIGGSALATNIVMQQEETVDTYEVFSSEWSSVVASQGGESALTFASSCGIEPLTTHRHEREREEDRAVDESEASSSETMKCDLNRLAADDDELTYTSQKSTDTDSLPSELSPTTTATPKAAKSRDPKDKYTKTPAMRAATKNKELIAYLIEAYRNHEKLWNPNHPEYKYNANRQMYNELAGPLQRDMQCSLSGIEIFGIITELRGRYRRELTKAKERQGAPFKTKLWYFDKLEFLRNLIEDKRAVRKAKTMESDTTECKQSEHRELQSYLLDAYKRREVLWNPKHPEFQHCNTQHQFDDIALSLQEDLNVVLSGSQCLNEIKRLRTCYRKELGFQAKRKGYVPKLWCFEQMDFLRPLWDEEISKRQNKLNGNSEPKTRMKFLRADPIPLPCNEQSLRLIEIYKGCPALWDVEHPDYRSTTYRSKTLSQMLEQVNCEFRAAYSVEQLEKTLHQMRKEYSAEKEKRLGGRVDASHMATEVYDSLKPILEENLGPFRCELCQILLKTSDQYKIHRSGHDGSKPFTCSLCGKGFQIPGNLTIHIRRHKRDYPYACELCDKRFPTTSELTIHIRSHTGERPYICDLCGKSFKTWSFFDIHRRAHLNQSPFHCPICDKGFYERNRFTDHMNIHLNIRKHNCTECGKAFTTYANLRKHQELHLPVKKYTCSDCKRGFSQFASLRWHMRTTHKDSKGPSAKQRSEDEAERSDAMEY